jgi:hypothetical protein
MPRIPNSCTLDLPSKGRVAERVLRADVLLDVIRSVVRAFEPDYAVVTSDAFRDLVGIPEPGRPLLGWITFLPVSGNHLPALPPPSRTRIACGSNGGSFHSHQPRTPYSGKPRARFTHRCRPPGSRQLTRGPTPYRQRRSHLIRRLDQLHRRRQRQHHRPRLR